MAVCLPLNLLYNVVSYRDAITGAFVRWPSARMPRQHRALPWISRKLVGLCCAALHGLRELAHIFYDWCAFGEVHLRGNRNTICCNAICCHDVFNGIAWRVFNPTDRYRGIITGAPLVNVGTLHVCDNVLARTPESRRRVGRVW